MRMTEAYRLIPDLAWKAMQTTVQDFEGVVKPHESRKINTISGLLW